MDHVEFDREPPTNLTTLVVAFGGWIDAGRAATGALRHLVRDLPAPRLARIDPEEFFVFTQERPEVRMRPDGGRDIHWPRSEFFAWHPEGRDGLLLFSGPEPHQRWRTYTTAFLGVAERCGVRQIVSRGALLAGAPHTRPVRVTARSNDSAARSLLEAWGIYSPPTYEGRPALLGRPGRRGATGHPARRLHGAGAALSPVPESGGDPDPVSYVARLLNLSPTCRTSPRRSRSSVPNAIRRWPGDRATRDHVRKLEQEYDATAGEERPPLPGGELDWKS
jgi:hypothetical protein